MGRYGVLILLSLCLSKAGFAQSVNRLETGDVSRFWEAFDQLPGAKDASDSLRIIQTIYLDRASKGLRKFTKSRHLSAERYLETIRDLPEFWASIRPFTENVARYEGAINAALDSLNHYIPGFKRPEIYFLIGCLNTGGTVSKQMILIGTEIAAADTTVNMKELGTWHKSILGKTGSVPAMVAHEAVHTQQSGFPVSEFFSLLAHRKLRLLNMAIVEGSADYIAYHATGLMINTPIYNWAASRHDELRREFLQDIAISPFDYSKWLYNGASLKNRPGDLGYYIGYKITEAYMLEEPDHAKAVKRLLKRGKYRSVYRRSGFAGEGNQLNGSFRPGLGEN